MLSEVDKDDLHITEDIQVSEESQISRILSVVISINGKKNNKRKGHQRCLKHFVLSIEEGNVVRNSDINQELVSQVIVVLSGMLNLFFIMFEKLDQSSV